jgi:glycosyltransferase involved in cell wall biosynthesis
LTGLRVGIDVLPLAGEVTGVGRFCAGLAGALLDTGEVELRAFALARKARADTADPAARLGLSVSTWPVPTRLANSTWARVDFPPIEWLVGRVEVVHGTNFVVPPTRRAGRVVTVHDLTALRYPELCMPASLAYPHLARRAIRHGAFVHVPSSFIRDEVVELLGATPDRVRVIPHGVDPASSTEPARRPAATVDTAPRPAPYVLALGAVEPRKDLPTLVKAFAELARAHLEIELVVAGPDGWGTPAFDAAVAASGAADRIVRVGYLEEAERQLLLRGATVLAFPSLYEGFGFPPLEAMAAGVPVVATDAAAVPEVVGGAAELVPPLDVGALAAALAKVIDDAGFRAQLVDAGRIRAASFTWAPSAASMIELYAAAASDRRTR